MANEATNQPPKPTAPLTEKEAQAIKADPNYGKTVKVVTTESGEKRKLGLLNG